MTPKPEPLAPADSAWLRMEDPTNLMTITGVMTLKEPVPFARFRQMIEQKLAVHDRFRMQVVPSEGRLGSARWVEREFELDDHVIATKLSEPGSKEALQAFVGEQMSTSLDLAKPLWRFHYIENFRGGSAMVARIHHCIGDGMALMKVILGMADPVEAEAPTEVTSKREPDTGDHQPVTRRSRILEAAKAAGGASKALGRLVTLRADPKTCFKGELGRSKVAVWSERMPLDEVKRLGKRLGATVNDVLLSTAAGALGSYLKDREALKAGLNLRAAVPVNLRRADDFSLGNKFGLVFLSLPVGLNDPLERLREVKRRMDQLKRSPEAFVVYGLLKALGRTNAQLQGQVVKLLSKNATAVMTNVPGPRTPITMCGTEIDHMMFWVPQSGRLGLGVSILSYNQHVRIGIATDRGLVPDPEALVTAFHQTLEELKEAR